MIEKEITILHSAGLHTRPAGQFAQIASRFQAQITLYKDEFQADGKSLLSLISLGAAQGSKIRLCADGPDERKAIEVLSSFVENHFNMETGQ